MDHSYASSQNHMDFHHTPLDRKPSAFSFDDNATLDSNILDTPVLMSPSTSNQGIFSPDTSIWEDFSAGQFVDRTATSSVVNTNGNNPFFTEQSNNPFARLPPNQAATYAGCNPQTIAKACRDGSLAAGQPFGGAGGRWRIHRDALDAWLRGERHGAKRA